MWSSNQEKDSFQNQRSRNGDDELGKQERRKHPSFPAPLSYLSDPSLVFWFSNSTFQPLPSPTVHRSPITDRGFCFPTFLFSSFHFWLPASEIQPLGL